MWASEADEEMRERNLETCSPDGFLAKVVHARARACV